MVIQKRDKIDMATDAEERDNDIMGDPVTQE